MEELTENAEEPDDGDSKKEEQKLGKVQYKVGNDATCLWWRMKPDLLSIGTVDFDNCFLIGFLRWLISAFIGLLHKLLA